MKCIRLYIILLFLGSTYPIFAQTPFAQANQLPLLLSPSMAGSKEQKRISIGANNFISDNSKGSNLVISYDQIIHKIGCGVGMYYIQNAFKENLINEDDLFKLSDDMRNKKYYTFGNQNTIGVCIAPKYNISYKDNPYKIKYTFSPSAYIELGKSTNTMICNPAFEYKYTFAPLYQNLIEASYYNYSYSHSFFRYGLGAQLNSKNLLVLGKINITRNSYAEQISYDTYVQSTNSGSQTQPISESSLFYFIQPTLHLGYTFTKNSNTSFAFSPMVGIGMIHYFNINAETIQPNSNEFRYNISQDELTEINYLHASANVRYKKLLLGTAYTQYQSNISKGVTLGFQNTQIKIMCTMGFNFYKSIYRYHHIELTSGFFF